MFFASLSVLQVNKVNRENDSQRSRQTLFVASKLVAACSERVLTFEYAITLHTRAIAFSAGLINGLQVDQVNRENDI